MRLRRSRLWARRATATVALVVSPIAAVAEVRSETVELAGIELSYRVILPNDYSADHRYPGVLAFPGGGQTLRIVDRMIERNWRDGAESRGYIVVSPAAPTAGLFFQGGDRVFPEFLDYLLERFAIMPEQLHVAGISNGGASAFHIASLYPDYFISVTGLPGYLPYANDAKIEALASLCIYMHVGERDRDWLTTMTDQAQQLTDADASLRFWIEPNEGHVMQSLQNEGSARLFEHFEDARTGCRRQ